jgi:hypothetical protein
MPGAYRGLPGTAIATFSEWTSDPCAFRRLRLPAPRCWGFSWRCRQIVQHHSLQGRIAIDEEEASWRAEG